MLAPTELGQSCISWAKEKQQHNIIDTVNTMGVSKNILTAPNSMPQFK